MRGLVRFAAISVEGHLGTFDPDPSVRKYLSANLPSRLCSGPPQLRQSNWRSCCEGGDSTRITLYSASQFEHRNLAAVSDMENHYSDCSVPWKYASEKFHKPFVFQTPDVDRARLAQ